ASASRRQPWKAHITSARVTLEHSDRSRAVRAKSTTRSPSRWNFWVAPRTTSGEGPPLAHAGEPFERPVQEPRSFLLDQPISQVASEGDAVFVAGGDGIGPLAHTGPVHELLTVRDRR